MSEWKQTVCCNLYSHKHSRSWSVLSALGKKEPSIHTNQYTPVTPKWHTIHVTEICTDTSICPNIRTKRMMAEDRAWLGGWLGCPQSAAQFFLVLTDHQSRGIFSIVKCLGLPSNNTTQNKPKHPCKPADFRQLQFTCAIAPSKFRLQFREK